MFRFGENLSQVQIRRKPYSGSDSERTLVRFSLRFGDSGSESTFFKFGDSLTQVQVQREPNSVSGSESILYLGSGSERE